MHRLSRWLGVIAVGAACAAAVLHARQGAAAPPGSPQATQTPTSLPDGSGLLVGQVVDAGGGGVSGAIVTLNGGFLSFGAGTTPALLPGGPLRVLSTSDGHFVFMDLPKGSYTLDASKPGYLGGAFGRTRPGGPSQSIDLADGERKAPFTIAMWRNGAISGIVTDEAGEPVTGIEVWALHRVIEAGHFRYQTAASGITGLTDDRGMYRIASLAPADYLVCVPGTAETSPANPAPSNGLILISGSSGGVRVGDQLVRNGGTLGRSGFSPHLTDDGHLFVYPTIFAPGSSNIAEARAMTVASGEDRTGVNIQLKPTAAGFIAGVVIGPNGPVPGFALRLVPHYGTDMTVEDNFNAGTTTTDARGAFTFLGIPTGQYLIRGLKLPAIVRPPSQTTTVIQTGSGGMISSTSFGPAPIPDGPTLYANVPVTVAEGGTPDVTITLGTGFHVTGRIEFDGTSPQPPSSAVQGLSILIEPADGHFIGVSTYARGQIDAGGQIVTYGLPIGKYFVRVAATLAAWQATQGWTFKSAMLDGHDVSTVPFDLDGDRSGLVITMTDRPSMLTGKAHDSQGRADAGAAIIAFTVDAAAWIDAGGTPRRLKYARAAADGSYKISSLPPGEYFVAAIPDQRAADWQDPKFLQVLARSATRVVIGDGDSKSQDVTTLAIR